MRDPGNETVISGAKFPSTALGYSAVRISCLDETFAEIVDLKASTGKDRKERKSKGKKITKTQKG